MVPAHCPDQVHCQGENIPNLETILKVSKSPLRTNFSQLRTFQREALLRHPELSMEMDRLASPSVLPHAIPGLTVEEPMSDTGVLSTEDAMMSGKRRGKDVSNNFIFVTMSVFSPKGLSTNRFIICK